MEKITNCFRTTALTLLCMLCCLPALQAQDARTVSGTVVDSRGESVIGAAVIQTDDRTSGTVTDIDGKFTLIVHGTNPVLEVSCIGMKTLLVPVTGNVMTITLEDDTELLEEVVVVGYGQQKKASVVAAITQTTGEVLERAGGVTSIGSALTGNLPGVITTQSSGMPGDEDPQIIIRSASSWNNSTPLVLVDGIERDMTSVDIASVQSISVLKDASATAVFGVKGANGVILITTRRGQEGRARININFDATLKSPSKLPGKYDSYDALMFRNRAIENELSVTPDSWEYIRPQSFIENYRNQTTVEQRERYPNVDWQDALFKDYAMSYNANVNVSGGTRFVKYYAAADYINEGDLFKLYPNDRGYDTGYSYNRINVRSNLDFQITKTTMFHVNIAGSSASRKTPYANQYDTWQIAQRWAGAYNIAPDVFLPKYSDGAWGYYPNISNVTNSAENLALGGMAETTTNTLNTDFTLEQNLDFITEGLSLRGLVSWDNTFIENNRGISDMFNDPQRKWIDPETGLVYLKTPYDTEKGYDWNAGTNWSADAGYQSGSATRNLYYSGQINYAREFGNHAVSAMGLFSRQETAFGNMIPNYREDWAFRVTYNWKGRYFIEYNGAYNGSEKFSKKYRFDFFQSGAVGWTVSEEPFMRYFKERKIIDNLKLRLSYGEVADDNISGRWLYLTQWAYGGTTSMDLNHTNSIYTWYRESSIGNEDVHWETVRKTNFGIDYSILGSLLSGSLEFFRDERRDILVDGSSRTTIPSYFGGAPPTANIGKVRTNGYELEMRLQKTFRNRLYLWGNFNMTHATNVILKKDDPELRPNYQKEAGYSIGQFRSWLDAGFIGNVDQLIGSPTHDSNDSHRLPGDYYIIDFNGDGKIDSKDSAPYGYSYTPQNTYSATLGFEWRNFSGFVQFYGVSNVTREVNLTSFGSKLNTVYDAGEWWGRDVVNPEVVVPRWNATVTYHTGTQFLYDASYVRLKNAELAYTFHSEALKRAGIENLKVFMNGNNLWLWTKMPDDREINDSFGGSVGAYPTVRRFNLGVKVIL